MANTTVSVNNANKPAPKWWRKLENGLLSILIPAIVLTLLGLGYDSNSKLILVINVLLVAIIKFVGYMLANGEVYAASVDKPPVIILVDALPTNPIDGVDYYLYQGNYWYWNSETMQFTNGGATLPTKGF